MTNSVNASGAVGHGAPSSKRGRTAIVFSAGRTLRAWLGPKPAIRVLCTDGSQARWIAADPPTPVPAAVGDAAAAFVAIEIPADLFLARSLSLPRMATAELANAVLLNLRSNNPFPVEDLASGYAVREMGDGTQNVEIVMASRRQIVAFAKTNWPDFSFDAQPVEAWAIDGMAVPVVFSGFGENGRLRRIEREFRWNVGLLVTALALMAAALITPTAQHILQAKAAATAFEAALGKAAPLVKKRDELSALNERLRLLGVTAGDRVDPAAALDYMTRVLPDDTYLYSIDVQKTKVTASGHTPDASALLRRLSADPKLAEVRYPTAVTRLPGATKEAFTVEFKMVDRPANGAAK